MIHTLEAPVIKNLRFPKHNYLLLIRAPEIARDVLPGQFVMAAAVEDESLPYPLLKRALAVYSVGREADRESIITLLLKVVGVGTRRLSSLQPGDVINLIGPLGRSFDVSRAEGRINLLVAGGIGIASFYLLAERLLEKGDEVHLIYGGRSAKDLVGLDDFRRLDLPVVATTEDGDLGIKGLVTEGLKTYLEQFQTDRLVIYTCGPNRMMQAVSRLANGLDIPCQISIEARMACGFGVCLGCSVKTIHSYRLACREGPVFEASEFVWEEEST